MTASRPSVGLADEDKTVELTVVAADIKENNIVVTLSSVDFAYDEELAKIELKDGKAVLTALTVGTVEVTATYEKVTSNKVTVEIRDGAAPVIKTVLGTAIADAEKLLDETEEGSEPGAAPVEAHTALEAAVIVAKTVFTDDDATQAEIDAAIATLNTAIDIFESAIGEVDEKLILLEDFSANDQSHFLSATYKHLPGKESKQCIIVEVEHIHSTMMER